MNILSLISKGKANAITTRQILNRLNIEYSRTNERKVRLEIEELKKLNPILSDSSGFYIPATIDESKAYFKIQKRHIVTLQENLKKSEKLIEKHFNQKLKFYNKKYDSGCYSLNLEA